MDLMVCGAKVSIHSSLLRLGQGESGLTDLDPKVGQTGPKYGTFSDQISVHFCSPTKPKRTEI